MYFTYNHLTYYSFELCQPVRVHSNFVADNEMAVAQTSF